MTSNIDKKAGRLFVLSAPSGSGKSTLKDMVLRRLPDLVYSISYTTRPPRPGEVDGLDYNFIDKDQFQAMIKAGEFLEWAEVFGRFYGTGKVWVEARLARGQNVLADIDVVGAASVRALEPQATLIFMVPPTEAELSRRLLSRRTETAEETALRLKQARSEIACRAMFDFLLINDDVDRTLDELVGIIEKGQGRRMSDSTDFWPSFFAGSGYGTHERQN